jgi:hypothetical protein
MRRLIGLIIPNAIFIATIMILFSSCGGPREQIYDSLAEAKKHAAGKDAWIVVEFWRHG